MKRFITHFGVALLCFAVGGLSVWLVSSIGWLGRAEPLLVTISPNLQPSNADITFDHYTITVKNVSAKTVRGFSLGNTCNCLGYDSRHVPYPMGINYSAPVPDIQVLLPGESREEFIPAAEVTDGKAPMAWADLVHFEDGTNWGPDRSRTERYVRNLRFSH